MKSITIQQVIIALSVSIIFTACCYQRPMAGGGYHRRMGWHRPHHEMMMEHRGGEVRPR